jgi:hypothetical protein
MKIDERPMLVSPEEASPDRSKAFNLSMLKIWRLKAFSTETRDIVKSFYPATYQTRISDYHSFEAMLANTGDLAYSYGWKAYGLCAPRSIHPGLGCAVAVACSSRCAYCQLEGSFHVSKPYVYSTPIAIENNESFPLGLCIAPSESIELYLTFFDSMMRLGVREADMFGKPLLSDRGVALMSYGTRFTVHFHGVWHLLENYGSNQWFTPVARMIAFATCENNFNEQVSRTLDDLTALVALGELNQRIFNRFSEEFGIIQNGAEFRFDPDLAGHGQFLWYRTKKGGVTTCTAHSERIHREAKTQCPKSVGLLRKMAMLITFVTRRFESAGQFPAEQARKELKKLRKSPKAAGLRPVPKCLDESCRWGIYMPLATEFNGFHAST